VDAHQPAYLCSGAHEALGPAEGHRAYETIRLHLQPQAQILANQQAMLEGLLSVSGL